jgi:hypothetical protein
MKTIQIIKAEIDDRTVKFWRRAAHGRDHRDYAFRLAHNVICDLKDDLAMLKRIERDGFVKGVNAVLDSNVVSSEFNLDIVAIVMMQQYDKGVHDND